MLLAVELTGRDALLFPEALALAFGVWVARRPEMIVSRWRIAVLPTVCAGIGVAATRVPGPWWLVAIGVLTVVVALLQLTRCRVAPALSAAVLPVVFDVSEPEYLITVAALCTLVAVTAGRRWPTGAGVDTGSSRVALAAWPWPRIAVFWMIGTAWIAVAAGMLALPPIVVAPPLLVATLEFVVGGSPAASGMRRTALLAVAGAVGGLALACIPVAWVAGTLAAAAVALLALALSEPLGPALAVSLVPFVAGIPDPLLTGTGIGLAAAVLHLASWVALAGWTRPSTPAARQQATGGESERALRISQPGPGPTMS